MVTVVVEGKHYELPQGTTIGELSKQISTVDTQPPLGAIAYGKLVGLDCRLGFPTDVHFVTLDSRQGVAIYRRTAALMLYAAVSELFPEVQVVVGQSLAHGYYFDLRGVDLDDEILVSIERRMRAFVEADEPVVKETMPVEEARSYFERAGYLDKVALLQARRKSHVHTVLLAGFRDIQHGPVATSCKGIRHFGLVAYHPGFVLQFDTRPSAPGSKLEVPKQSKLFHTYRETREWNEILLSRDP
jgi:uridine kinase